MRHGSEQQQPPYQQRHCEPRNPGFNNRENPQHDEQYRRRDIPSRDFPDLARWAPQTFRRTRRRHATPPRTSVFWNWPPSATDPFQLGGNTVILSRFLARGIKSFGLPGQATILI